MWIAAGLILLVRMRKENRIFYLLGPYFLFLGAWEIADGLSPANLFAGAWGWVFRAVTALVLVFACAAFYRESKKNRNAGGGSGGR